MNIKLIGSKITKIQANRNPDFEGTIKLETNVNISSIDSYKANDANIETIKVIASFVVDYHDLGKIEIEGQLFFTGDKKDLATIKDNFNKKQYNKPEMISIMNIVLQKFSLKAFEIEDEFGLPVHIKLPTLQMKK